MKKRILGVAMGAAFLVFGAISFTPQEAEAQTIICKWKTYDCSGWANGTYDACVTIGDGNTCTCGTVTRQCPKPGDH